VSKIYSLVGRTVTIGGDTFFLDFKLRARKPFAWKGKRPFRLDRCTLHASTRAGDKTAKRIDGRQVDKTKERPTLLKSCCLSF